MRSVGSVGCLLIGDASHEGLKALGAQLAERSVATAFSGGRGDVLSAAQEGLYAVRGPGGVCVAAEGEFWAAALALAAQLCVERVVLIAPTDRRNSKEDWERQIQRLKGFARRNLFFCVSDVLVLEKSIESRQVNQICRRLTNAKVLRVVIGEEANVQRRAINAAVKFLIEGDFTFSLAE